jgi:hypothetical protein
VDLVESEGASPAVGMYLMESLVQACCRPNVGHSRVVRELVLEGRGLRGGRCSYGRFSLSSLSSVPTVGEGLDMHLERLVWLRE